MTIREVAERSGVSIGAVSFALSGRKGVSDDTRERVLRVAEDLGWAPTSAARSLAGARTQTVGLVLARDPMNLGVESFYMQFLAGIERELATRSYSLLLQVAPSIEHELATLVGWRNARKVDGVLLVDLTTDDPRVALAREPHALPTLVVGDPSVADGLSSVWTDDAESMRTSVRHLVDLGHRRIARVSGIGSLAHTRIRDRAFNEEMRLAGLEPLILPTDYTPASGSRVTLEAMRLPSHPTAFIYDNDVMAVAGLGTLHRHGVDVPGDVSIIAWDDSVLCQHVFPRLTALSHDVVGFGSHAARRLFDVIAGAPPGAFLDSTPALLVRDSTASPSDVR